MMQDRRKLPEAVQREVDSFARGTAMYLQRDARLGTITCPNPTCPRRAAGLPDVTPTSRSQKTCGEMQCTTWQMAVTNATWKAKHPYRGRKSV